MIDSACGRLPLGYWRGSTLLALLRRPFFQGTLQAFPEKTIYFFKVSFKYLLHLAPEEVHCVPRNALNCLKYIIENVWG